jgi:hypothetical protein
MHLKGKVPRRVANCPFFCVQLDNKIPKRLRDDKEKSRSSSLAQIFAYATQGGFFHQHMISSG